MNTYSFVDLYVYMAINTWLLAAKLKRPITTMNECNNNHFIYWLSVVIALLSWPSFLTTVLIAATVSLFKKDPDPQQEILERLRSINSQKKET